MQKLFFGAFSLALLVFPITATSSEDCIPGKTPVQCGLTPSPMEFDQCKENRTPILCGLPKIEDESECPAAHIESDKYQRVSCMVQNGINISIYAKKETQISGFHPKVVLDFDYAFIFVGESQNASDLAAASGFMWKNGKIKSFLGTSLGQIIEKDTLLSRHPHARVRKERKWYIGDENFDYMGPGDNIDCATAFKRSDDQNGLSIAIQICQFAHDTDGWKDFRSFLGHLD